jgi:hypothetical protein
MIEGKVVKVRFKKYFAEQRLWVFIGKTIKFSENWIMLEGKGILVSRGTLTPVDIDKEKRIILIPNNNIAHIRVLPENFDVDNIEIHIKGVRIFAGVKNGPDTSISEI